MARREASAIGDLEIENGIAQGLREFLQEQTQTADASPGCSGRPGPGFPSGIGALFGSGDPEVPISAASCRREQPSWLFHPESTESMA